MMADSRILVAVREHPQDEGAGAEQLVKIREAIESAGFGTRWAVSAADAEAVLRTEAGLAAALVAWDLPPGPGADSEPGGAAVLRRIGRRFQDLPVFLVMTDEDMRNLPLWVSESVVGYVWPLEDTPAFIAGRITTAARAYREAVLPPFFRALRRFDDAHEYSWHTPAHSGGVAFLKSPVGRAFHDYFGERLLRSDLSISVGELGSLFEHTGPIGEAEHNAARVFGSDHTYFVCTATHCNGWSPLQRHARRDRAVDVLPQVVCRPRRLGAGRCTDPHPQRLRPRRATAPAETEAGSVTARIAANPLAGDALPSGAQYAVFTNSTTTASVTTQWRRPARSPPARPGCTSTRRGSPTPASIRSTPAATACRWARTPSPAPNVPPSSRPSPPTSCWPRCRRAPWCTSGRRPGPRSNTTGSTRR
ncbi:Orn/Lys/Arg decarboxylase, major domain protein [Streptomyces ipomoeae 91-03]|uniref:Orn/Lys/Arg decarboxylase, major domain protein n=1 Tax=Streptomyces ipomoeae 91-03 TaxID=698759 RepID=L1KXH5_9ACTN|nr:Orn/Lys/Arg decarboxylase, major domain protein [Streptomyces ipomoeae 91-03]